VKIAKKFIDQFQVSAKSSINKGFVVG